MPSDEGIFFGMIMKQGTNCDIEKKLLAAGFRRAIMRGVPVWLGPYNERKSVMDLSLEKEQRVARPMRKSPKDLKAEKKASRKFLEDSGVCEKRWWTVLKVAGVVSGMVALSLGFLLLMASM
jgi:hypothetical protein